MSYYNLEKSVENLILNGDVVGLMKVNASRFHPNFQNNFNNYDPLLDACTPEQMYQLMTKFQPNENYFKFPKIICSDRKWIHKFVPTIKSHPNFESKEYACYLDPYDLETIRLVDPQEPEPEFLNYYVRNSFLNKNWDQFKIFSSFPSSQKNLNQSYALQHKFEKVHYDYLKQFLSIHEIYKLTEFCSAKDLDVSLECLKDGYQPTEQDIKNIVKHKAYIWIDYIKYCLDNKYIEVNRYFDLLQSEKLEGRFFLDEYVTYLTPNRKLNLYCLEITNFDMDEIDRWIHVPMDGVTSIHDYVFAEFISEISKLLYYQREIIVEEGREEQREKLLEDIVTLSKMVQGDFYPDLVEILLDPDYIREEIEYYDVLIELGVVEVSELYVLMKERIIETEEEERIGLREQEIEDGMEEGEYELDEAYYDFEYFNEFFEKHLGKVFYEK